MLLLDLGENDRKLIDQIVLFAFLAKNCWHLLLQVANNVCMSLEGDKAQMRHKIIIIVAHLIQNASYEISHPH